MITLKYWNSLTPDCRVKIAKRFFGTQFFVDSIVQEYHHNFDYDDTGKELKVLLSACYLKDGQIEVRCRIAPTFQSKSRVTKTTMTLHRYYFRLYTQDDPEDGETIWEDAYSEQEAINKAYRDFHSIARLDLIKIN